MSSYQHSQPQGNLSFSYFSKDSSISFDTSRIKDLNDESLQQNQLILTLQACHEEVNKLDEYNARLLEKLTLAEETIENLSSCRIRENILEEENQELQASNLKLQAMVLSLEKSIKNKQDLELELEKEKQAYSELEKKYEILTEYYNELLLYLREGGVREEDIE